MLIGHRKEQTFQALVLRQSERSFMVGERSCVANRHIFTIYSPKHQWHKLEVAQLKTSDFFSSIKC